MNVFIITRKGTKDTPILVLDDTTAQATFDDIAEDLIGEDVSEIGLHFDEQLFNLNHMLRGQCISVDWFEGIEVNDFVNDLND